MRAPNPIQEHSCNAVTQAAAVLFSAFGNIVSDYFKQQTNWL